MNPLAPSLGIPADPRIDSVLIGKYRIEELLGQGGAGRVYRATHILLNMPVAVKFLTSLAASREELRGRFEREARILAHLCHPGIVSLHDYGEEGGELYLIMEYIAGTSLSRLMLEQREGISVPRIVALISQILDALTAAHASGIVHRDIKPSNIMRYQDDAGTERIKLLDFGLALVHEAVSRRLTAKGQVVGTVFYMAPEQCTGKPVGTSADIYSIGVVLYQMLAGRLPFCGKTPARTMEQHLNELPPPLDLLPPTRQIREMPPQLGTLTSWALAKSPVARPTALQFREALWQAMETSRRVRRTSLPIAPVVACELPAVESVISSRDDNPITVEAVVLQEDGADGVVMPRITLWGFSEPDTERLVTTLWPHKLHGIPWNQPGLPPAQCGGHPIQAILLPGDEKVMDRLGRLRTGPPHQATPVLVCDVLDEADVIALIRAGASDLTLMGTGAEVLGSQVVHLVRKRR